MTFVPLKSLCQIKHGGTPSKANSAYWQGEIPWVSPKDMKLSVLFDAADHITDAAIDNSATSLVPVNSILVVVRSGILAHTLPVAQVGRPLAFNQDIKALIPNSEKIDPDFLFWFVRSQQSRVLSQGVKKGATVHSLQSGFIENLQVPLLARTEQRRIVELLSRAEGIVRLRREAQQKAVELIPAIFLDMFGDPATNPKGWKFQRLDEVSVDGPTYGANAKADDFHPGKARYIRITDIDDEGCLRNEGVVSIEQGDWEKYRLEKGDLLFARSGNTVGKCLHYVSGHQESVFAGYLIRFRFDPAKVLPGYVHAITRTYFYKQWVQRKQRVAGQPNINGKEYASFSIPTPPLDMQRRFVDRIEAIAALTAQQYDGTRIAEATFNSVLSQFFGSSHGA